MLKMLKIVGGGLFVALLIGKGISVWMEPSETEASVDAESDRSDAPVDDVIITDTVPETPATRPVRTMDVSDDALYLDFRLPLPEGSVYVSAHTNEYPNSHYGGPWRPDNIDYSPTHLALNVVAGQDGEKPSMAELRAMPMFHYGRYETIMRPALGSGVISAFFTYTGPVMGDPHDEIDIEFSGLRPDQVEFNYFKNGKTGAHSRHKLDFDATKEMRLYAFEWHPDKIIWFIDDEEVYRTPEGDTQIPTAPGQLFISAWAGSPGVKAWVGKLDFGDRTKADCACMSFTPFDDSSRRCADMYVEDAQFIRD